MEENNNFGWFLAGAIIMAIAVSIAFLIYAMVTS